MTIAEVEKIRSIPIMFIMGKERSGTTLLQAMLNAHPNIAAPHESRIIIYMYARYGKVKKWTKRLLDEFCDELYNETRFSELWQLDKVKLKEELHTLTEILTYSLIFKLIYCMTAPDKEVKVIFDKNPVYYLFLKELNEIFPDAKYIHIIRDYRDNIVSHQAVMPDKSSANLAYRWVKVNNYMEEEKEKAPQKWFTIKYEELVNEPLKYMKEIYAFIQVPFYEDTVTGFSGKLSHVFHENAGKKNFAKFHWNVYNPVNTNQIGQYRKIMPTENISIVESIAGPLGKQYGYKLTLPYKVPSMIIMMKAKCMFTFFRVSLRSVYKCHLLYKTGRFIARALALKDK